MKEKYNLLDIIPYKAGHIITEWEGELAIIAFPRFKTKWAAKYLLPKRMSPLIRVRLEEHGTAVWTLIDGKRTVRDIINLMAEHFGGAENYQSRVTTYLAQLQKDGFVKYRIRVES